MYNLSKVMAMARAEPRCDVCSKPTNQVGLLSACWAAGSTHAGQAYEVRLCEACFFGTLAGLRRERSVNHIFSETVNETDDKFGLLPRS